MLSQNSNASHLRLLLSQYMCGSYISIQHIYPQPERRNLCSDWYPSKPPSLCTAKCEEEVKCSINEKARSKSENQEPPRVFQQKDAIYELENASADVQNKDHEHHTRVQQNAEQTMVQNPCNHQLVTR